MIERKMQVTVEPTSQELAFEFCNMGAGDQANFFNEVAALSAKWANPFCFQLQYIVDHDRLTDEGKRVMEQIGEYGQDRVKESSPALLQALEESSEYIASMVMHGHLSLSAMDYVIKARAAIAAARGE